MALPKTVLHSEPSPKRGAAKIVNLGPHLPAFLTMTVGSVEPGSPEALELAKRLRALAKKRKPSMKHGATATIRAVRDNDE